VFDQLGAAMIGELLGHPRQDAGAPVDLAQQQRARVRADVSAVEPILLRTFAEAVKLKLPPLPMSPKSRPLVCA